MTGYKTIEKSIAWTDKTQWRWPAGDLKLVQVFEHVADIDVIMPYVHGRSVCVQAGGACGVWPLRFSQLFDTVYTFEALKENFKCLLKNTEDAQNIQAFNAPLSDNHEKYSIHHDIIERQNFGAGYTIKDPKGLTAIRIDDLSLDACDLIQLDIEGDELSALKGGAETIDAFRPVIVLEEKKLNHVHRSPREARRWLENNFGYELREWVHRDVILTC